MIMGARQPQRNGHGNSGQSLMEFMLVLPLLLGLAVVMIRVSIVIQASIVNQQYARAQALFLTYNSPFYPDVNQQIGMIKDGFNQMVLGVSDNPATGGYTPLATVQYIGRRKGLPDNNEPKVEPVNRYSVRVRNSVTLCAPSVLLSQGQPVVRLLGNGEGNDTSSVVAGGPNPLMTMGAKFSYICGSPLRYYE